MKRWITIIALASALCFAALGAYRLFAAQNSVPSLARYAPPGGLLYLEARDFSGLLSEWNGSPGKAQWIRSANYEVFSRSRLFSRLKQASDEFSTAAGLPPDMNFVSQVAGSQSALVLYDIGKLQFLYITRLDSSKADQTALLQSRAKFETRSAAGVTFYYRQEPRTGREVAFAFDNGYLLLATREDLMAASLELLAGGKGGSIEQEPWWARSVAAAGQPGDLRMVLNLDKIVPSPYFRSYWIQQNISEMRAYSSAVSDLILSRTEYREDRVLLEKSSNDAASSNDTGAQAVAALARLVPSDAGTYEIQSSPSADSCVALLETKLLAPHIGPGVASQVAPQVQLSDGAGGGTSDMETRIDQSPPKAPTRAAQPDALKTLLAGNPVQASMSVQRTSVGPDGVFVRFHTAIVLLGSSDWDESSALSAIAEVAGPMLTTNSLGVVWRSNSGIDELDGLWNLSMAVRGKYLFLSDEPSLLTQTTAGLQQRTTDQPATFAAGFNHASERANYHTLTAVLDDQIVPWPANAGRPPAFLSDNVGSLSSALSRVSSEKVVVRRSGDKVLQTVTYEWAN